MSGSRAAPYFPIFPLHLISLPYNKISKEATIISSLWDKRGLSWPSTPKESRIKKGKKFSVLPDGFRIKFFTKQTVRVQLSV